MWSKNKQKHLPFPEGPYIPGCIDIMTEYSADGCFVRLFYPSSLQSYSKDGWIPWLAHEKYVEGLAFTLKIWKFIMKLVFYLYSVAEKYIPVMWQAEINDNLSKLPVVVFSPGWGTARFFYSTTCSELASHGFVVAAVEHRDQSSCISYYYESAHNKQIDKPTWIYHKAVGFGEEHFALRKFQVNKRAEECCRVLELLEKINNGTGPENLLNDKLPLLHFKGKLDLSNLVMMGHSFGGSTALQTLGMEPKFKVGVILDAWMFPLKDDYDLANKVTQPLLFLNTQTFQTLSNSNVIQTFCRHGEKELLTVRNTTHEHQSDTPHVLGSWLNLFMRKLNPLTATKINHRLILQFLKKHIAISHLPDKDLFLNSQAHNVVQGFIINKEKRALV